jgi:hypothetical protein
MEEKPAYGDNDAFNENVATLRACLDKTIADLHDLVFHPDNNIPERFEDDEVEEDFVREEPVIPHAAQHEVMRLRCGTSHSPDPEDIWNNPALDPRTLPESRKVQPRDTIFEEHYASFDDKETGIPCAQEENRQHKVMRRRHGTSQRPRKQTRQQKITAHYTRLEKQLKLILAAQKSALAQADLEQQKTDTDNKAVNDAKAKEEAEATEYLLGVFERVGKRMAEESQDQYIQGGPGVYEKLMNMNKRE